jgi:hypothetical protein
MSRAVGRLSIGGSLCPQAVPDQALTARVTPFPEALSEVLANPSRLPHSAMDARAEAFPNRSQDVDREPASSLVGWSPHFHFKG